GGLTWGGGLCGGFTFGGNVGGHGGGGVGYGQYEHAKEDSNVPMFKRRIKKLTKGCLPIMEN
ncbi:hypothetical protein, partial [Salmonella enterica]|uniref:hypothetical protein n=1 Tax=Salmonella enterica TaxID=28901 RepID=UPI0032993CD6